MIADSTALIAFFLRGTAYEGVAEALSQGPLVTLELALKEVYNTVLQRYWRGKLKNTDVSIINKAIKLSLEKRLIHTYPQRDLLDKALDLSLKTRLSIFDSFYLALADQLSQPLLTLDPRQRWAAEKLALRVVAPSPHD